MSLLGKIGSALTGALTGYATGGPAGALLGGLGGLAGASTPPPPNIAPPLYSGTPGFFAAGAAPTVIRSLPALGRVRLPAPGTRGGVRGPMDPTPVQGRPRGGNGGGAVVPVPIPYERGGRRRYRRINPCNPRALRRAIRRVKAFRKLSHAIEMMLPKRPASKTCAPRRNKC
jgi:hypothetical protein